MTPHTGKETPMRLVSHNPHIGRGADDQRRALLATVHIAVKKLAMHDDDYRALLVRVTGTNSAKACDRRQLAAVVAEFERLGFDRAARAPSSRATHPVAKKARALWISLYQLGAIGDASEAGLETFGQRQLGVERLQWADQSEGFRLIEALKAMAQRAGWDQRVPARMKSADRVRLLKERLVGAQIARLTAAGETVTGPIAEDRAEWSGRRLDSAITELAGRIRACPAITGEA